jgi:hypothetical protein
MQHYSSVIGLLNQTRNGCGGVRILKTKRKTVQKKHKRKLLKKENFS